MGYEQQGKRDLVCRAPKEWGEPGCDEWRAIVRDAVERWEAEGMPDALAEMFAAWAPIRAALDATRKGKRNAMAAQWRAQHRERVAAYNRDYAARRREAARGKERQPEPPSGVYVARPRRSVYPGRRPLSTPPRHWTVDYHGVGP